MSLTLSHCFVTVHDQDAALAFYRDVLGLKVRHDMRVGSMRWLTVAAQAEGGTEILETDDVDALFAKAVASGAAVVQEPKDQPYGVRDCAVRDPSQNMVRFAQPSGR
jgi:predicted enzyme related to lactoylglutathione lyase